MTKLKKLYATALLLMGLSTLTGCNNTSIDEIIDKATQQDKVTAQGNDFCQARTVPFSHSLCEVKQSQLTEVDSGLSLHLFWKAKQIDEIDEFAKLTAENADSKKPDAKNLDSKTKTANKKEGNTGASKQHNLGDPLYTFDALLTALSANTSTRHNDLKFAVNAGMYNTDFAPIGYTVMQGQQILSINLNEGGGNFHLMPNGVLWWNKAGDVYITESNQLNEMLEDGVAKPWYATQSGPMLVIKGKIHPKFNKGSDSKKIRNGVGVCDDGMVKFVTSNEPVNFYQFATLFKEDLDCPNALFLDGGIASALYAPNIGKKDNKNMGVMIGLVENP